MMDHISLCKLALEKQYGISAANISRMQFGVANHNFLVQADKTYVLKLLNPQYAEHLITEEMPYVLYLKTKNFPLPVPIKTISGEYFAKHEGNWFLLYDFIAHDFNGFDKRDAKRIGELHGELHTLPVPETLTERPDRRLIWQELVAKGESSVASFFLQEFSPLDKKIMQADLPTSIIHSDGWSENFLLVGDDVIILDWESVEIFHRLLDLVAIAVGSCYREEFFDYDLFRLYLQGYQSVVVLTSVEKDLLYDYILHYLLWGMAWRYVMFDIRKHKKEFLGFYTEHRDNYLTMKNVGKKDFLEKLGVF